MDRVGERVRRQIELVEEQTGSMDPKVNFHLIIVQTELERVRFLVRSLLRARLAKIDAHPHHHHLMHPHPLSPSELAYLRSHLSLLSTHFATSFLSSFPEPLRKLDERGGAGGSGSGSTDMVQGPDLDQAVFVRVLEDVGTLRVSGTDVRMELRRGDVWVARWSAVREAVLGGRAELI
ncbi:hypothetical protein BDY21DRAFT_307483 [Lineolata rhizophorae]|uniref:DNA replication complex GINS protein SLD5 n=1 Tax=Lineolata rhizophorae TaxID=578093 RepID=A0A6A6NU80_9PEZI|nr:hypothetical protein BDY21DRAFT_307483 [Lineolata rhizophorae]